METMSVVDMLKDFASIKLPPKKREFVDSARRVLQSTGDIPYEIQRDLRKLAQRYSRQMTELHLSRDRARRTNWKIRNDMSEDDAMCLIERRRSEVQARKSDLGI